jgi:gamma-glutamyltranspeptidase/glutathione hydrolase
MANINAGPFTTRPEIDGTFGVVASTHWIGTAVGMSILERGGNAFDAGVATAFTLQVVEPHLCGPGGDIPAMLYDAKARKPVVVCGQGPAPAGATIAHYRDHLGLDIVPGTGLLPACVPGTFETYMLILRDYGTMRLRDVLEVAIGYARNGYPLVEFGCSTISTVADLFHKHWPTSAAVYLPRGKVPEPNSLFTNGRHAETYERILKEAETGGGRVEEIERARRAWSQGFVAEAIDQFCRTNEVMDVSGRPHTGVLTAQDMATWLPTVEEPIHLDYGNYRVLKPNAWTQGPVLLQMLALLKGFDLDKLSPTDVDFIHTWVECAKLAYADRETFYGDPKFVDVPMETLLSEPYNTARRKLVGKDASMEQRPGKIEGFGGRVIVKGARAAAAGAGAKHDPEMIGPELQVVLVGLVERVDHVRWHSSQPGDQVGVSAPDFGSQLAGREGAAGAGLGRKGGRAVARRARHGSDVVGLRHGLAPCLGLGSPWWLHTTAGRWA